MRSSSMILSTPMCVRPRAPPPDRTTPIFGRFAGAVAVAGESVEIAAEASANDGAGANGSDPATASTTRTRIRLCTSVSVRLLRFDLVLHPLDGCDELARDPGLAHRVAGVGDDDVLGLGPGAGQRIRRHRRADD